MGNSDFVHVWVNEIVRETEAAFLCRLDDETEVWIPKSQCADPEDYAEGDANFHLAVTEWIAREKGLEGEEEA